MYEWSMVELFPIIQEVINPYNEWIVMAAGVFIGMGAIYTLVKRVR